MNNEELLEKDCIEVTVKERTYVTKKINSKRRAMIINKIFIHLKARDESAMIGAYGSCMNSIGKVIWEFIKDEDKKDIGTADILDEEIDDKSSMLFFKWAFIKTQEVNDFLSKSPIKAPTA